MNLRVKKILLWAAAVVFAVYAVIVIIRIPHAIEQKKTAEVVAKIHASKLTLDDVVGKNFPPDPGADGTAARLSTSASPGRAPPAT